jgi:hypothetical protein
MANESTTGGPLTATLGEQLAGKGHLGAVHEAEKAAGGAAGEATPHAGAEVEPREQAATGAAGQAAAPRALRGMASRVPWGAILAAGAGWVLAKTVADGLRRPARRIRRGLHRR